MLLFFVAFLVCFWWGEGLVLVLVCFVVVFCFVFLGLFCLVLFYFVGFFFVVFVVVAAVVVALVWLGFLKFNANATKNHLANPFFIPLPEFQPRVFF